MHCWFFGHCSYQTDCWRIRKPNSYQNLHAATVNLRSKVRNWKRWLRHAKGYEIQQAISISCMQISNHFTSIPRKLKQAKAIRFLCCFLIKKGAAPSPLLPFGVSDIAGSVIRIEGHLWCCQGEGRRLHRFALLAKSTAGTDPRQGVVRSSVFWKNDGLLQGFGGRWKMLKRGGDCVFWSRLVNVGFNW